MKKIIYRSLVALFALLVVLSCEKEYVAPANTDFSDPLAAASGANRVQRGDFTSFADLSKGVVNRTWTIPGSAEIINANGKDPSELDIVHIQFNEPGEYEINLQSEFQDANVMLDTSFPIEVLDYIQAKIEIISIEAGFYEQTPTQIKMYEGGAITFADSSQGKPNRRIWTFKGGDPERAGGVSVDDDADVKFITVGYPTIGTYDVELVTWRQYPEGDPDTVLLKNFVDVIKNVDPPSIVDITEGKDGVIQLKYNLAMKVGGDLLPHFGLTVDGASAGIADISINPADNRILDITPGSDINHNSEAVLTYDGNGPLTRLNDTPAPAFSDESVIIWIPPNVLSLAGIDPSFESGSLDGWNPVLEAANANPSTVNTGAYYEIADEGYTGNKSMVVHLNPNEDLEDGQKNNFRILTNLATHPLHFEEGKTYQVEFWYKIVGGGMAECTTRMHGAGWAPAPGGGWTSGNATDWKFRSIKFKAPNPTELTDGRISLQFISKNNVKTDMYIDDITVFTLDE